MVRREIELSSKLSFERADEKRVVCLLKLLLGLNRSTGHVKERPSCDRESTKR